MPLAVLVQAATVDEYDAILDVIDAQFAHLSVTTAIVRKDGLLLSFTNTAETEEILEASEITVNGTTFTLSAVVVPKVANTRAVSSDAPATHIAAVPSSPSIMMSPLESNQGQNLEGKADDDGDADDDDDGEEAYDGTPTCTVLDLSELTNEYPLDEEDLEENEPCCECFPKLARRVLSFIGIILGTLLTIIGIERCVMHIVPETMGYQLFARWLFPYWIICCAPQITYAEVLRLKPSAQLGRWRPLMMFRHRGTRGLIMILIGSVSLDLDGFAIVLGFLTMLVGLLNIFFGIWAHTAEFVQLTRAKKQKKKQDKAAAGATASPTPNPIPPLAIGDLQATGTHREDSDDGSEHVKNRSPRRGLGLSETSLRRTQWCKFYPILEKLLVCFGFLVGICHILIGFKDWITEEGWEISEYAPLTRYLFPWWMITLGLGAIYAEFFRLPYVQRCIPCTPSCGNKCTPPALFWQRGSRGAVYFFVGSLQIDYGIYSTILGFVSMTLGLLNAAFAVWGWWKDLNVTNCMNVMHEEDPNMHPYGYQVDDLDLSREYEESLASSWQHDSRRSSSPQHLHNHNMPHAPRPHYVPIDVMSTCSMAPSHVSARSNPGPRYSGTARSGWSGSGMPPHVAHDTIPGRHATAPRPMRRHPSPNTKASPRDSRFGNPHMYPQRPSPAEVNGRPRSASAAIPSKRHATPVRHSRTPGPRSRPPASFSLNASTNGVTKSTSGHDIRMAPIPRSPVQPATANRSPIRVEPPPKGKPVEKKKEKPSSREFLPGAFKNLMPKKPARSPSPKKTVRDTPSPQEEMEVPKRPAPPPPSGPSAPPVIKAPTMVTTVARPTPGPSALSMSKASNPLDAPFPVAQAPTTITNRVSFRDSNPVEALSFEKPPRRDNKGLTSPTPAPSSPDVVGDKVRLLDSPPPPLVSPVPGPAGGKVRPTLIHQIHPTAYQELKPTEDSTPSPQAGAGLPPPDTPATGPADTPVGTPTHAGPRRSSELPTDTGPQGPKTAGASSALGTPCLPPTHDAPPAENSTSGDEASLTGEASLTLSSEHSGDALVRRDEPLGISSSIETSASSIPPGDETCLMGTSTSSQSSMQLLASKEKKRGMLKGLLSLRKPTAPPSTVRSPRSPVPRQG
uniref:Uncharacterized protein n=1 Tax=Eutreptiella gymnastica TaxID=73025 RepID=A0A7S1IVC8_9EUGL|mmetsp:Transcript_4654/g.8411  ORF Transcript_4654/g.8411 Transcript_4654/m.8411 type:complete len:1131 (+) Transcript_4654:80-3472(+)